MREQVKIRLIDSRREKNLLLHIHREYDREYGFKRSDGERGRLVEYLADHDDTLIIVGAFGKDGGLASWARLQERTSSSSCDVVLMLDALHVFEGHRGHGIGDAMVAWIVEYARSRSIPRIDLLASLGNEAAIKLYEKHGFIGRKRLQMMLLVERNDDLENLLRKKIREEKSLEDAKKNH